MKCNNVSGGAQVSAYRLQLRLRRYRASRSREPSSERGRVMKLVVFAPRLRRRPRRRRPSYPLPRRPPRPRPRRPRPHPAPESVRAMRAPRWTWRFSTAPSYPRARSRGRPSALDRARYGDSRDPFAQDQAGWTTSVPQGDPYSGGPATVRDTLYPYTGRLDGSVHHERASRAERQLVCQRAVGPKPIHGSRPATPRRTHRSGWRRMISPRRVVPPAPRTRTSRCCKRGPTAAGPFMRSSPFGELTGASRTHGRSFIQRGEIETEVRTQPARTR